MYTIKGTLCLFAKVPKSIHNICIHFGTIMLDELLFCWYTLWYNGGEADADCLRQAICTHGETRHKENRSAQQVWLKPQDR